MMKRHIDLAQLLGHTEDPDCKLASFALLALGIAESLSVGALSANDVVTDFFNGDNCFFVEEILHDEAAKEIMGRGVQLADLFDALPHDTAQRELESEITAIRAQCLALLKTDRLAA
jgi:hypothetical protein